MIVIPQDFGCLGFHNVRILYNVNILTYIKKKNATRCKLLFYRGSIGSFSPFLRKVLTKINIKTLQNIIFKSLIVQNSKPNKQIWISQNKNFVKK